MKDIFLTSKDYEVCDGCGCLVASSRAQKVDNGWYRNYYCQICKKPYDKFYDYDGGKKYWGKVEMEEDGTPVGYKKINKDKK